MDNAVNGQLGFQYPASPVMLGIIELHNHICFFLVFIIVFTFYMLIFILLENSIEFLNDKYIYLKVKKSYSVRILHNVWLETLWIIFPTLILLAIAVPSFALLYGMEVARESYLELKVTGHQWYWSYDLTASLMDKSDLNFLRPNHTYSFSSFMKYDNELTKGLRLLETTHALVLPVDTNIKVLITASDVLHSWAVPAFGVKMDACPGRLNQIMLYIDRKGHYYGQCSELCGVNHGFMPIEVNVISKRDFAWYFNAVTSDFYQKILVYKSQDSVPFVQDESSDFNQESEKNKEII